MAAPKQYGLIIPNKGKKTTGIKKPSVFNDSSDEDEKVKKKFPGEKFKEKTNQAVKKQTQLLMQKAMQEDPTVYEYDSIYDDMKRDKEEKRVQVVKDKKPRYIENLLKAAENRKREAERRYQRKIHQEREAEGALYEDKEAFVTTAYKKKMQEMQEEEEREMKKEQLESMMDVTKQKDLMGFYRHLLNQQMGEERIPENTDQPLPVMIKTEKPDSDTESAPKSSAAERKISQDQQPSVSSKESVDSKRQQRSPSSSPDRTAVTKETREITEHSQDIDNPDADSGFSVDSDSSTESPKKEPPKTLKKRHDSGSSDDDTQKVDQDLSNNPDADSDFSVDSDEETDKKLVKNKSRSYRKQRGYSSEESPARDVDVAPESSDMDKKRKRKHSDIVEVATPVAGSEEPSVTDENKPPQTSLKRSEADWLAKFVKRNVGQAFEDARARYLARKEARTAFGSIQ